jgi:hypothetical protein
MGRSHDYLRIAQTRESFATDSEVVLEGTLRIQPTSYGGKFVRFGESDKFRAISYSGDDPVPGRLL